MPLFFVALVNSSLTSSYLQFYLDLVATSENIPLLFHLANKGKTVRDAESHGHSEVSYDSVVYVLLVSKLSL